MLRIYTEVTKETLSNLLTRLEESTSIMWPADPEDYMPGPPVLERPTQISEAERKWVNELYYSEEWGGLLTYGDISGEYTKKVSNEEFLSTIEKILPKEQQIELEI